MNTLKQIIKYTQQKHVLLMGLDNGLFATLKVEMKDGKRKRWKGADERIREKDKRRKGGEGCRGGREGEMSWKGRAN